MDDLISVIITVYNNEKSLKNALLSVISQTYRNMEIIIIDDGSTDSSPKICDELLISNSKLKVHHQVHSGLASARNKGIQMSSGKYVTFLNATDTFENTLLENLKNMMDDFSVELSICRTFHAEKATSSDKVITFDKEDALRQLLISNLIQNNPYAKLFDKRLFSETYFADNGADVIYRIFEHCSKIAFMNNELYKINETSDNFSLNSILNKDIRIMSVYPSLKTYCKCNIVKSIQDEFYYDICNNKLISDENKLYEMFSKIVKEDEDDIITFYSNIRKAHMYLLADDFAKYKMICPVLPDINK